MQLQLPDRIAKYSFFVLLALLVVLLIGGAIQKHRYEAQLAELRNAVAMKDKTIEVQKDVYSKLTIETDNLKATLDTKDQEVKSLLKQLQKTGQDLLDVNQLVIQWKKAYEGLADSTQTNVPPSAPGSPQRKRVDFKKDFGAIAVSGYTLTDPAESWLKVEQLKPLKLTVAVSQDKSGAWHSYVTTDDDNTTVDIAVTAVNPYLLEPKWYESIQLNSFLAAGPGLLAGVGASYRFGRFDVGPAVFITTASGFSPYYGATFTWRPFQK